ncbi:MAG: hypothetical protein RIK87_03345 [Fuerstiella sp.]
MALNKQFRRFSVVLLLVTAFTMASSRTQAQLIRAPLDTGFVRTSSIAMTVDEMLGSNKRRTPDEPILGPGYPDLTIAEVQYKPVRYRRMEVTDPATGQVRLELVWYMVYRVIPRDCTELAGDSRDDLIRKLSDANVLPQNTIDEPTRFPLQIPRFVLRTEDAGIQQEYVDEVNLEIQRNVLRREFRNRAAGLRLLNSVQTTTEVVDSVSVDAPDQLEKAMYGVAVWRDVDPTTDYLTVTMTGFSNAYRIRQEGGETIVEHKVIEQRFGRPGDEFNQQEDEFRLIDSARLEADGEVVVETETLTSRFPIGRPAPAFVDRLRQTLTEMRDAGLVPRGEDPELTWPNWHYERREAEIAVPEYDRILRNARADTDPAAAQ